MTRTSCFWLSCSVCHIKNAFFASVLILFRISDPLSLCAQCTQLYPISISRDCSQIILSSTQVQTYSSEFSVIFQLFPKLFLVWFELSKIVPIKLISHIYSGCSKNSPKCLSASLDLRIYVMTQ